MEEKIMLNKLKAIPHEIIFAIAIFIIMSGIMTGRVFMLIIGVLLIIAANIKRHTDEESI
jgi:hypothetical protein